MPLINRRTPSAPRALIILSSASIAVHLWSGFTFDHGAVMSGFMIAMALVCLPCTVSLLRSCTAGNLTTMMTLAVLSALVHGAMLIAPGITGGIGHSGHAGHGSAVAPGTTHMTSLGPDVILITLLEIGILILALDLHVQRKICDQSIFGNLARLGRRAGPAQ